MKFTLSEWESIKCVLGTAFVEAEECATSLEEEVKKIPLVLETTWTAK